MRFSGEGNSDASFDLSDVPTPSRVDTLADVLAIAREVELENAAAPGITRIERLARFVVESLGRDVRVVTTGSISKLMADDGNVCRVGSSVFLEVPTTKDTYAPLANPLELAAALVRGTELACGD